MLPLPLSGVLVDATPAALPAGFTPVTRAIDTGLPLTIALVSGFELLAVMPTGLARHWIDAHPGDLVSSSDDERVAHDPDAEADATFARAPLRWLIKRDGRIVASVPFTLGVARLVCDAGSSDQGVALEIVMQSWKLFAGSMRGGGDFGSQVEFAWRKVDRAVDEFGAPLISRRVLERKPPEERIESHVAYVIPRHALYIEKASRRLLVHKVRS